MGWLHGHLKRQPTEQVLDEGKSKISFDRCNIGPPLIQWQRIPVDIPFFFLPKAQQLIIKLAIHLKPHYSYGFSKQYTAQIYQFLLQILGNSCFNNGRY